MDTLGPKERSERMSRIQGKGMKPEMAVRRLVHSMGFRYRLHVKDLPGKPDIVFRPKKKVIFVHGCFWHRHSNCKLARMPKSRIGFWQNKLEENKKRDTSNFKALISRGWVVLVIWECQIKDRPNLKKIVRKFLSN